MSSGHLAAVLASPGRFEYRRIPLPAPAPGDVRVRLQGRGVCGSNLPVREGRGVPLPRGLEVSEFPGEPLGCERVIECVGLQWPLDLAAELVAERGRLDPSPFHTHRLRLPDLDAAFAHLRDRPEGFRKALIIYDY